MSNVKYVKRGEVHIIDKFINDEFGIKIYNKMRLNPFQNLDKIDVFEAFEKAKLYIPEHKHQPLTVLLFLKDLLRAKEYLFSYFVYENIIEYFKRLPNYGFSQWKGEYWVDDEYERVFSFIEEEFGRLEAIPNKEMEDFREERRIADAIASEESIAFAIESDRWLAQHLGKSGTEPQTIQSSGETLNPKPELLTLVDIKKLENKFNKEIPMADVISHFKPLTTLKNKIGLPFLTDDQFILFLRRAFLSEKDLSPQIINYEHTDKGLVVKGFRLFYDLAVSKHDEEKKLDKYINLLVDNFVEWDYTSTKAFFKRDKTKRKWH